MAVFSKNRTLAVMGAFAIASALIYRWRRRSLSLPAPNSAVIVTGCDAGIGLGVAVHAVKRLGLRVIALVRDPSSSGSKYLKAEGAMSVSLVQCDLLHGPDIERAANEATEHLDSSGCRLLALVNNAGVMTMGKIEWQTTRQIEEQVTVNFLSPVVLTKLLLTRLRRDSSRIVNVSSHCALHALPHLSVYSATKSALDAWSDAIRLEGLPVVTIRPGSYVAQSRILARLAENRNEMWAAMTDKARQLEAETFNKFYDYMAAIPVTKLGLVDDPPLMNLFDRALLEKDPKQCYVNSPWRYSIYYILFSLAPTYRIKRHLIYKFVAFPE